MPKFSLTFLRVGSRLARTVYYLVVISEGAGGYIPAAVLTRKNLVSGIRKLIFL
jgi:hypothetical protein